MNKNPFIPQPTYNPPQPPLPPGPPPAAPTDYSAYWAAAHQQQQQQAAAAYTPAWTPPQPPRPPPEQSALYANYGYGGGMHWQQRHNHPQQQPYQPPPPVVQPPPPPPQQQYNPYQPSVGYQQPYVPQAPQQPMVQQQPPAYPHPQQTMAPPQPYFPQQQHQPQQQQQQQPRHNHGLHHTPPQHLPPAKRQRFDGPSQHHAQNRQLGPSQPPPQPQFLPPPAPPGGIYPQNQAQGQGQPGTNQMPLGGNRPGMGGRGGNMNAGRGRGAVMSGNRGGLTGQRGGRGGSIFMNNGSARGGGAGQQNALRGHGSRGGFGKDFHSRRGGSFNAGHQHHQNNAAFRGRGQGHASSRAGRQDGSTSFGNRDASQFASSGKKDENRRTLTDFKIVGLEMPELGWSWGVLPSPIKAEEKEVAAALLDSSQEVKEEEMATDKLTGASAPKSDTAAMTEAAEAKADASYQEQSSSTTTPPPSRIRIYFHTPVSPDDSHPIPHNSSYTAPPDTRKGKRKKLEDDDGDAEEGRERPPPPRSSQVDDNVSVDMDGVGRGSAAPSLAETASEGDWLMAAIAEDEGDVGADADADADAATTVDGMDEEERHAASDPHFVPATNTFLNGDGVENGSHNTDMDGIASSGGVHESNSSHAEDNTVPNAEGVEPSASSDVVAVDLGAFHTSAVATQPNVDILVSAPEEGGDNAANSITSLVTQPVSDENVDRLFDSSATLADPSHATSLGSSFDTSSSGHGSPVIQSDMPQSEEQSADHTGYPDTQVSGPKPLQAEASFASTIPDDDSPRVATYSEEQIALQLTGDISVEHDITMHDKNANDTADQEHLPEPPASPASNTLLSTSSGSTYGEPSQSQASTAVSKGGRVPSANRLSISYAAGSRRLVVDAEVVECLKVCRSDGRIEVQISLDKDSDDGLKGVLIEGLSDATKSYSPLPTLSETSDTDETLPCFSKATLPSKINLMVHLDTERPLSEPKWVKSGDIQEWLKSMFGRMFWVAGDAADGWEKKISVVDPDPAPTIWTVLDGWAVNSPVGAQTERQRFVKTHLTEVDNMLEILLRLVRGERATPFSQSTPAISAPSVSGPLLTALSQSSSHGAQQTHVSLAVLALFHMSVDFARKASGEKGKAEAEEKMSEIVRCLPSHLLYKSLDGMFKEWRADKKGTR
ncbi:hypothetical protein K503DRAFT_766174 [Rhizopogon vinicolor AM-OR11-026]|uniref:Uncharacterized protein n=1 Tax=Rhizopogon vinicolor AM-OR11-026 TaxID=1314800 RepID=A0A1B7NE31_9AGAM|nr:hypothetical protein K503DRAFT_766174 [Rhizopogon vinicolor AM-OR11-026]